MGLGVNEKYTLITPKGTYEIDLMGHGFYITKVEHTQGESLHHVTGHVRTKSQVIPSCMQISTIVNAVSNIAIGELPQAKQDIYYKGEYSLADVICMSDAQVKELIKKYDI